METAMEDKRTGQNEEVRLYEEGIIICSTTQLKVKSYEIAYDMEIMEDSEE